MEEVQEGVAGVEVAGAASGAAGARPALDAAAPGALCAVHRPSAPNPALSSRLHSLLIFFVPVVCPFFFLFIFSFD